MGLKRGRNCAVIWASWAIWPSTTLSNSTVRRWLTWLTSIAQSWRRAAKPSRWHRGSMRNAVMPVDMQERRRDIIDYVFWRGQAYMAGQTKSNAGAVRRREFNYWRSEIAASSGDTKRLWRTFSGVLGEVTADETAALTADAFATFFQTRSNRSTRLLRLHRSTTFHTRQRRRWMHGQPSLLMRWRSWSARRSVRPVNSTPPPHG